MFRIDVEHTQHNSRDGTKNNQYAPGGITLVVRPIAAERPVKVTYRHLWLTPMEPEHPQATHAWFGREGWEPTYIFPPLKKEAQLRLSVIAWPVGDESQKVTVNSDVWVMAGQPTPRWTAYTLADNGRYRMVLEEMKWLQQNPLDAAPSDKWLVMNFQNFRQEFEGTIGDLVELLQNRNPIDPTPPPDPAPDPLPFTVGEIVTLREIEFEVMEVGQDDLILRR